MERLHQLDPQAVGNVDNRQVNLSKIFTFSNAAQGIMGISFNVRPAGQGEYQDWYTLISDQARLVELFVSLVIPKVKTAVVALKDKRDIPLGQQLTLQRNIKSTQGQVTPSISKENLVLMKLSVSKFGKL